MAPAGPLISQGTEPTSQAKRAKTPGQQLGHRLNRKVGLDRDRQGGAKADKKRCINPTYKTKPPRK